MAMRSMAESQRTGDFSIDVSRRDCGKFGEA